MQILVVDDNPLIRAAVTRMLKRLSLFCLEAEDGHEALKLVEQNRPELVLCDYCMPSMSGMEVLAALRQSKNPVRFGLMTGEENPELNQHAREMGAEFVLFKPFPLETIKTLLSADPLTGTA